MAESSRRKIPTRRRTAPRPTQPCIRSASIEGWISDEDRRDEFVQIWKNKALISPKYITLRKFTTAGFEFPALFNFQGIRPFVEMHGTYYPDLVRVFYYNLKIRDEVALSKVKGVDIIIDNDIWENVAKFPINDAAESILHGIDGFNRILAYQSFLRNPAQDVGRQLLAGGLKMDERLIHYLIVWILCPRGTNHAQCSEADLLIMYAILNRVPIKWSSLILDTMLKAKRYPQYPLPYSLLISRICEYKGVDTTGELCQSTLRANEIAESSLKQLKLVPLGDTYVHRDVMSAYFCPHLMSNYRYLIEFVCLKIDLIGISYNWVY